MTGFVGETSVASVRSAFTSITRRRLFWLTSPCSMVLSISSARMSSRPPFGSFAGRMGRFSCSTRSVAMAKYIFGVTFRYIHAAASAAAPHSAMNHDPRTSRRSVAPTSSFGRASSACAADTPCCGRVTGASS